MQYIGTVMKTVLKIIGVLVVLLIIAALFINFRGIPSYDVAVIDHKVVSTPESVAKGKKYVMLLCANCHMSKETRKLTGKQMLDAPKEFGTIYSANITQDDEYGIGTWTDGELIHLLRTGVKRDGKYAPPYMAKLPNMADTDLDAIISFLRSDDPLVAADHTPDKPCEPSFLTKFLCTVAFKPLPLPEKEIPLPDTSNKLEFGRYLAHNYECFSCHSEDFKTMNFLHPEQSGGYFGGGNKPLDEQGRVMVTPNLTPDKETGIGNWSEEKFTQALRFGTKDGEPALRYPMLPYSGLTDYEASCIYTYLQSIPPITNKVERSFYDE